MASCTARAARRPASSESACGEVLTWHRSRPGRRRRGWRTTRRWRRGRGGGGGRRRRGWGGRGRGGGERRASVVGVRGRRPGGVRCRRPLSLCARAHPPVPHYFSPLSTPRSRTHLSVTVARGAGARPKVGRRTDMAARGQEGGQSNTREGVFFFFGVLFATRSTLTRCRGEESQARPTGACLREVGRARAGRCVSSSSSSQDAPGKGSSESSLSLSLSLSPHPHSHLVLLPQCDCLPLPACARAPPRPPGRPVGWWPRYRARPRTARPAPVTWSRPRPGPTTGTAPARTSSFRARPPSPAAPPGPARRAAAPAT